MDREEKKYEVLPGIKTPDIKSILEAASDFSNPGVENVAIKGGDIRKSLAPSQTAVAAPTKEEIENLKTLGIEVGEAERRASEESKKKMDAIKKQVMAPESLSELKKVAASKPISDEKREQIDKELAEKKAVQAEEEAKNKAREERKFAQQKKIEEIQQKKAEEESRKKIEDALRKKKEELMKQKAEEDKAAQENSSDDKKEAEAKTPEKKVPENKPKQKPQKLRGMRNTSNGSRLRRKGLQQLRRLPRRKSLRISLPQKKR